LLRRLWPGVGLHETCLGGFVFLVLPQSIRPKRVTSRIAITHPEFYLQRSYGRRPFVRSRFDSTSSSVCKCSQVASKCDPIAYPTKAKIILYLLAFVLDPAAFQVCRSLIPLRRAPLRRIPAAIPKHNLIQTTLKQHQHDFTMVPQ
jgi:hypothetical protein